MAEICQYCRLPMTTDQILAEHTDGEIRHARCIDTKPGAWHHPPGMGVRSLPERG